MCVCASEGKVILPACPCATSHCCPPHKANTTTSLFPQLHLSPACSLSPYLCQRLERLFQVHHVQVPDQRKRSWPRGQIANWLLGAGEKVKESKQPCCQTEQRAGAHELQEILQGHVQRQVRVWASWGPFIALLSLPEHTFWGSGFTQSRGLCRLVYIHLDQMYSIFLPNKTPSFILNHGLS